MTIPQTLYVIDGHAQIYRAYYALPPLNAPSGEPTNATLGFVSALLKLLQTKKPSQLVLAMDAGSSGRELLDSQYKAHRQPMPEDMRPQIERIMSIAHIMALPTLRIAGFEADDVIATLVQRIGAQVDPPDIFICSRDKDLDQLVGDKVRLYDIQTGETIDAAALIRSKGYSPQQAGDVLALTGDTADNIQGIPGVGPKTAAKWISQFGNLDNLIAHAGEISGKIGQALRDNLSILAQSRQLVQLRYDVPLELPRADFDPTALAKLEPVFHELQFQRLLPVLRQTQQVFGITPVPIPVVVKPSAAVGMMADKPSGATAPKGLFDAPEPASPDVFTEVHNETSKAASPPPVPAAVELPHVQGDYRLVNSTSALDAMLHEIQALLAGNARRWLAVDTETDSLSALQSRLCGISLAASAGLAWYIPVMGPGCELSISDVSARVAPLLADKSIQKIGQNLKYDMHVLRRHNMPLDGIYFDTMVAGYLVDAARQSLAMDSLAADYLKLRPIPISDLIGSGGKQGSFANVSLDRATRYAAEDADVTYRLAVVLFPLIGAMGMDKLLFELEMPLVEILAEMERTGIKVNTQLLGDLSIRLEKKIAILRRQIMEAAQADFNPDSPKQLAEVLFNKLHLPAGKKTKTGYSTNVDVLESLADQHPVPALVLEYRQLGKLKNTYVDSLIQEAARTGRVHAQFNQTVAETGRLSSSNPNLQNIPIRTDEGREIRRAFIADGPDKVLLAADYSQIELRVMAHYCREPALRDAFARNQDIHQFVATEIYHVPPDQVTADMRRVAKTVNFGIIYGQTAFGLKQVLKISQTQAEAFITAYKQRFPGIAAFSHDCIAQAEAQGFVTTILGRRRPIPEIKSSQQSVRSFGQRAAVNTVIQGSAADLIKQAMVRIAKIIRGDPRIKLLLQVHDELVFECSRPAVEEFAALVRQEMEQAILLAVPVKVEVHWADNWLEAK
ncbi:MAG: DNA polymerase I [Phycisphaerae bacterium]